MRVIQLATSFVLLIFLISCATPEKVKDEATVDKEKVTELLSDVPSNNQAENQWLYSELTEMGPPVIHYLAGNLSAPGYGDAQTRYTLSGMAKYASRPGAESERKMYERTLLNELQADHHPAVKGFMIEQIELTGSDRAVPVLASFLGDNKLHESAVHALRAIDTPPAEQALLDGFSRTKGAKRLAVVKALGDMEITSNSAAKKLISYASSGGENRQVTLYALAQTGNPAVRETLVSAVDSSSAPQKIQVQQHYLLFAKRLAAEGHVEESSGICLDILSDNGASNVKSSALEILTENEGEGASNQLFSAATSVDNRFRIQALRLITDHPEWQIWDKVIEKLDAQSPDIQADIIEALGKSGRGSVAQLRPYLNNPDQSVRIAAVQTLAAIKDSEKALPDLLERLNKAEDPKEIEALKTAMLQLPTDPLLTRVAGAIPSASDKAKVALIEILAERRATNHLDAAVNQLHSQNKSVRLAVYNSLNRLAIPEKLPEIIDLISQAKSEDELVAYRKAVVNISLDIPASEKQSASVINGLDRISDSGKRGHLYRALPKIGGEKALQVVVEATGSQDTTIQNAALEALADWQQSNAVSPILKTFREAPDSNREMLLKAYLRLVNNSKYSSADKVEFLNEAFSATSSTEERVMVVQGYADLESPQALQAVVSYFGNTAEEIKNEAIKSAAAILYQSDGESDQVLSVLEATVNREIRSKMQHQIQELRLADRESDTFTSLFNGEDFSGWVGDKNSYRVQDGQIISRPDSSGNLFTENTYSNFVLRFEFKLTSGANNGLAIRSPLKGNPAYNGIELQILDNKADQYADLEPYQYHGSIYGVVPAERGYLNAAGEWNKQEVTVDGSKITVKVNGQTILDSDLEEAAKMGGKEYRGLHRESGHIGFLGHGTKVAFRNIRIKDLNAYSPDYSLGAENREGMNQPPEGFKALFNGINLEGWRGLVGNPESRAKMNTEELARKQREANERMQKHWSVQDGVLHFDGKGESLVTQKKYEDFEMLVDWKIEPGGDSGIYLRGSPQVQIWDITEWQQGSGGLYNNQNHQSEPLVPADNAIGEWNTMRIKMVGEKVTVHLNNQLVVPAVVMENYWNRDKPIYSEGQIELQAHNTPLYFKNVFIRKIPRTQNLISENNLNSWQRVGGDTGSWVVADSILSTSGSGEKWKKKEGGGWLSTTKKYDNFKLELEYRLPKGGNSGVYLRAPHEGDPAYNGIEIQLLDNSAEEYADLNPWQYTGSIYGVKAPSKDVTAKTGEWQKMEIVADGPRLKVKLNGEIINSANLVNFMDQADEHPGLKRRAGYIGLQNYNSKVEFRNIKVSEIK